MSASIQHSYSRLNYIFWANSPCYFFHSYQFNQGVAAYCFPGIAFPLTGECRTAKYIKDKASIFVMWVLAFLVLMGINTPDSYFLSWPQYLSAVFVQNNCLHRHLLCLKIYTTTKLSPENYYIMSKIMLQCHFILIQSNSFWLNRLLPFQTYFQGILTRVWFSDTQEACGSNKWAQNCCQIFKEHTKPMLSAELMY